MSVLYPKAKEALLKADIDMENDTIRAVLIDTGAYTYNAAHDFYNDIAGVVGTESSALTGKTFTNGVFDADNVTFTAVSGNTVEAIILFKDTGSAATDALIAYVDSATSGLPLTPNSGDVIVSWSGSGIFSL